MIGKSGFPWPRLCLIGLKITSLRRTPALHARRLADQHGERRERPESDQFEFHHAGHTQRKFLQNFVRFSAIGGVHDEDDTVPLGLEEPLLDLPGEMVAYRGADLEGQDQWPAGMTVREAFLS